MKREIKFRAWISDDERMLYSDHDVDDDYMEVWGFDESGPVVQVQELRWREGGGEVYEECRYVDVKCEIMQFTGLKDKNGVDIYEGDIVDRGKGEIFYDTKRAQFRVRWHDPIWITVRGANQMYQDGEPILGNHEIVFEVIGNIYQHPNLINNDTN